MADGADSPTKNEQHPTFDTTIYLHNFLLSLKTLKVFLFFSQRNRIEFKRDLTNAFVARLFFFIDAIVYTCSCPCLLSSTTSTIRFGPTSIFNNIIKEKKRFLRHTLLTNTSAHAFESRFSFSSFFFFFTFVSDGEQRSFVKHAWNWAGMAKYYTYTTQFILTLQHFSAHVLFDEEKEVEEEKTNQI